MNIDKIRKNLELFRINTQNIYKNMYRNKLIFEDNNINTKIESNTDIKYANDEDIWSDEDKLDDATVLDNFIEIFNINTYSCNYNPDSRINKKLGSIVFLFDNKRYKANYSINYPKIVHKNEVFNNLKEWISYIKKNNNKNKTILNFIKEYS